LVMPRGHQCHKGCLFAIGNGGRVWHVASSPFAGDPPRHLCGHFVITAQGRPFELSVDAGADLAAAVAADEITVQ
jgi:hypothetical protein